MERTNKGVGVKVEVKEKNVAEEKNKGLVFSRISMCFVEHDWK